MQQEAMKRREFLRHALYAPVAVSALTSLIGERNEAAAAVMPQVANTSALPKKLFVLPPLPYPTKALEPHIDRRTMEIHHGKHHATYVKNLNDAVEKNPGFAWKSAEDMIQSLNDVPEAMRTLVRNNGGGHVNHTMFWQIMKPRGGGNPTGPIADAIKGTFGSADVFKAAFNDAGAKRFGSGWVWLVRTREGKMEIMSTPNQDNPMMDGHYPILGNDVWEHAYYLKYQNRRPDYLKAWWNVVNWDAVNKRLAMAPKG